MLYRENEPIYSTIVGLRPRGLDVDGDLPPLALAEPGDGEGRARQVSEHDRRPDVGRVEAAGRLENGADSDRHDDLRDDRDVERAARVTGALEATGVGEGDGDEESRHAQEPEQLTADRRDEGLGHPEDAEQTGRDRQEQR